MIPSEGLARRAKAMWPFRSKPDDGKPKRCGATSGLLMGYQCSLEKGHVLPHEAITSVTRDGSGHEVGRSTTRWPVPSEARPT